MKKVLKEKDVCNIVKRCLFEAMTYDKERRQYFPQYTGNPHSDAGKFVDNNRDDFNYARNDYQWSNPKNQERFTDLQWKNDLENYPFDPDKENQDNAELYLQDHEPYTVIEKATQEMSGEFDDVLHNFFEKAAERYPILKDSYYMSDFVRHMRDVLDDYDY